MAISRKVRFEVFKRDGFTCQYCGRTPPAVVLEADHIDPKANGGLDLQNNLVTACFDCNRGKRDRLLTTIPQSLSDQSKCLKEREEQLKAYRRQQRAVNRRQNADIALVEQAFRQTFSDRTLNDRFKESIRKNFLPHFTADSLASYMHQACDRMKFKGPETAVKYFCGMCWGKIKDHHNA